MGGWTLTCLGIVLGIVLGIINGFALFNFGLLLAALYFLFLARHLSQLANVLPSGLSVKICIVPAW